MLPTVIWGDSRTLGSSQEIDSLIVNTLVDKNLIDNDLLEFVVDMLF